jgi:hypothetical protein
MSQVNWPGSAGGDGRWSVSRAGRWGRALVVLSVVVLAAACGSSATSAPNNPAYGATSAVAGASANSQTGGGQPAGMVPGDICSLLTQAQVDGVAGGSIGPGVPQNDGVMCLWQNETLGQVSISVDISGDAFSTVCNPSSTLIMKVDGVGDGACFLLGGKLGTSLQFTTGGHIFTTAVVLPNGTLEQEEAADKALALDAIAKL